MLERRARSPPGSLAPRCGRTSVARPTSPIPPGSSPARPGRTARHACWRSSARPSRCPPIGFASIADADRIDLGDRSLEVVYTPGHASHHVALHDQRSGAVFTGEAIGSHLPWAQCFRPALPPPEVDVEAALASIDRIDRRRPTTLLTSHFGPVPDAEYGCRRAAERIRAWSETVRATLEADPDVGIEAVTDALRGTSLTGIPGRCRPPDRPRSLRRDRLDRDERSRPVSLLAQALAA